MPFLRHYDTVIVFNPNPPRTQKKRTNFWTVSTEFVSHVFPSASFITSPWTNDERQTPYQLDLDQDETKISPESPQGLVRTNYYLFMSIETGNTFIPH